MKVERQETSYAKGVLAEKAAALYLTAKGFEILHTRYKTALGEIDLIARHDGVIVFVEVKVRRTLDEALFSISARAQKRIARAAEYFLALHPEYASCDARFDVVAMNGSWPFSISHLDNAWQAGS